MSEKPLFDTHSTMGPKEYRRAAGIPDPPSGDAVLLTFAVSCPPRDEDAVKARVIADLQAMGLEGCHYRREPWKGES